NFVTCNGKLHWYNGRDIVALDPFDTRKTCFIECSPGIRDAPPAYENPNYFLGVCRGFLRLM
ncbi:hypothetical protein Tsubulata_006139, partial [Turnera subulata]